MTTLGVGDAFGASLYEGAYVTALLTVNCTVVVGTDAGSVLAFAYTDGDAFIGSATPSDSENITCDCVYARALHYGPVHCLAASSAYLVASAGHDATPAIQPISSMITNTNGRAVRLHGHTLAVTCMAFFSTGSWLATCSVGGHIIIFDTSSCTLLCEVRVGFPVRCLALAPDETMCYVGGTQLARVDLYDNDRPLEPLLQREEPFWMRRYAWNTEAAASAETEDSGEGHTSESPSDLFIAALHVDENGLTAIFQSRDRNLDDGAIATWRHDAANFWLSSNFRRLKKPQLVQSQQNPRQGVSVSCSRLRIRVEEVLQTKEKGNSLFSRASDGWSTWGSACVRVGQCPPTQTVKWTANVRSALPLSSAAYGRLGCEEERERRLQGECDELVEQLKAECGVRGIKKKRHRDTATT
ncbi:WD domain [Trypanosoma brucei equiperdum]|uniref:WD domain n=1 Tax=Trypanosoma brucei equiperdum TaxID=630700 RepID=A0A3L6L327_9TRYP|nr:WD domain [Trypanosoma brucei equiperdum]